jgi:hypothetical protein
MDLDILKEKFEITTKFLKYFSLVLAIILSLNLAGYLLKRLDLTAIGTIFILFFYWIWSIDTKIDRLEKTLIKKKTISIKELKMSKKGASDLGNAISAGMGTIVLIYLLYLLVTKYGLPL